MFVLLKQWMIFCMLHFLDQGNYIFIEIFSGNILVGSMAHGKLQLLKPNGKYAKTFQPSGLGSPGGILIHGGGICVIDCKEKLLHLYLATETWVASKVREIHTQWPLSSDEHHCFYETKTWLKSEASIFF